MGAWVGNATDVDTQTHAGAEFVDVPLDLNLLSLRRSRVAGSAAARAG